MNLIKCPLMGKEIVEEICFDISMVVEEGAPAYTALEEATKNQNYKEVCLNCPNHRFD